MEKPESLEPDGKLARVQPDSGSARSSSRIERIMAARRQVLIGVYGEEAVLAAETRGQFLDAANAAE